MVETRGLVGAIEAADAMCKAAGVRLSGYEITTDALVTVLVRGPLADVEASVMAGSRAAERVGELIRGHVIPSPASDLERPMLSSSGPPPVF
jgi:ethanolamine utilization protein EutM